MAVSTRALRVGLAATAVLLVGVVAGFIGYAHWRARAFVLGLPGRLGIDITQETDHFTYSQSLKGKTVFTVHAAKEMEHKDGRITLHDVGIVLYGAKGDRDDRIHGMEFEYDQKDGILRAIGEAVIDLGGPVADKPRDESRVIHVKTQGLVFRQKERTAATDAYVEFQVGGLNGNAIGADYDAGAGRVVLRQQVKVSGLRNDRPMALTAAHAEMDLQTKVATLESPHYVSTTDAGPQTMTAEHAVVHTDGNGNPSRVEAQGRVGLVSGRRGTVSGDLLDVDLDERGNARDAHLYGAVRYVDDEPARHEQGRARDAQVAFDAQSRPQHATFTGAVQMDERLAAGTRHLDAERVELALGGGGKAPVEVRAAEASGGDGARIKLLNAKAAGSESTGVRADLLRGRFAPGAKTMVATGLDGTGHTLVERVAFAPGGAMLSRETSTGATLSIDFAPVAPASGKAKAGRSEVERAVQHGGVESTREVAATAKKPAATEHARADDAAYDAERDELVMTGGVQVADGTSLLLADRVQLDRATDEARADGAVRVNYLQDANKGEPVHVLAAHADAHKATGVTEFTAVPGALVRMWQGGSTVEAPVVDFDRAKKIVRARGDGRDDAVKAVLVGERKTDAARVYSQEMVYTDQTRQVDFAGGVRVNDKDGTLHAQKAVAFLAPAGAKSDTGFPAGQVERIVGDGTVVIDQPGRRATGDKIVYTASDETFVLTGTKAAPPRLTDQANGSVTGGALRFRKGDDSVEVVGGEGHVRVRTEVGARQ